MFKKKGNTLLILIVILGIMVMLVYEKNIISGKNTHDITPVYATGKRDTSKLRDNNLNYNLSLTDPSIQKQLKDKGFVVLPNKDHMTLYEVYYKKTPLFVTSDSILHTSHLIFDWYLRYLEIAYLRGDLINLTDGLLAANISYYDGLEDGELKESALKNSLYFTVAKQLLSGGKMENMPENLRKAIKDEIILIEEHKGTAISPVMGYKEDYSQYIPRGHYNRSPEFHSYFKAMMWYGRIYFPANNDLNILQTLLICKALKDTKIKGETASQVWERIYKTTAFFTGESDDLLYGDYEKIIEKTYGKDISIKYLSDKKKLSLFKEELKKLKKPAILSIPVRGGEKWDEKLQGFRFMGQRFTFDSYIFQNLVYDRVKKYKGKDKKPFTEGRGVRTFARGLDVMAVLGSTEAKDILIKEGDTDFNCYNEQFEKLESEKENYRYEDLYNGRLWLLEELFKSPGKNVPPFMATDEWKLKQLNTALGSWTELKHDTILYTKQPYTMEQRALSTMQKGGEPEPTPAVVKGYVEPSPEIYKGTALLFKKLRENLLNLGFPKDNALERNLTRFEQYLSSLEEISRKELSGKALSEEEYRLIEDTGSRLHSSLSFGHYFDISPEFQTKEDDKMPVIADVLTDINSEMVLEQATGTPFLIFAEIEIEKEKKICRGAVYSYFEFKWPAKDRLTDEKWRDMLLSNKEPELPQWTDSFMIKK